MAIRAGVGLPGPFFLTFPIGGPIIGLFALMLAPVWLMFIMCKWLIKGMVWLAIVAGPPIGAAIAYTVREVAGWISEKRAARNPAPRKVPPSPRAANIQRRCSERAANVQRTTDKVFAKIGFD